MATKSYRSRTKIKFEMNSTETGTEMTLRSSLQESESSQWPLRIPCFRKRRFCAFGEQSHEIWPWSTLPEKYKNCFFLETYNKLTTVGLACTCTYVCSMFDRGKVCLDWRYKRGEVTPKTTLSFQHINRYKQLPPKNMLLFINIIYALMFEKIYIYTYFQVYS